MTEPGHSSRACEPLFVACEHFWSPLLLLRLLIHRFRSTAPAPQPSTPPSVHSQVIDVLRVWLEISAPIFSSHPTLFNALKDFLNYLRGIGGWYRGEAEKLAALSQRKPEDRAFVYPSDYAQVEHEVLYEVRWRVETACWRERERGERNCVC